MDVFQRPTLPGGWRLRRLDGQQRGGHLPTHRRPQLGDLATALRGAQGAKQNGGHEVLFGKHREIEGFWLQGFRLFVFFFGGFFSELQDVAHSCFLNIKVLGTSTPVTKTQTKLSPKNQPFVGDHRPLSGPGSGGPNDPQDHADLRPRRLQRGPLRRWPTRAVGQGLRPFGGHLWRLGVATG